MPDAGTPLVRLQIGELRVISHLISLLETLKNLRAAEIVHGDICERNVCSDALSIRLIDFGEVAPRYANDIVAAGGTVSENRRGFTNARKKKGVSSGANFS